MTDEKREIEPQELTDQELEAQDAEQLPDREAMSLVNANVAAPVNVAAALNVLSDGSTAVANAEQTAASTRATRKETHMADETTPQDGPREDRPHAGGAGGAGRRAAARS